MNSDIIKNVEELKGHYGQPVDRSLWKEIDHINEHYQQFIEASPFCILATHGEKGVDCSPRGDPAGLVTVESSKLLLLPDRNGNNRIDSLINIVENPSVGLIFLIPGVGETVRVKGRAEISIEPELCGRFVMQGKAARSVLKIHVEKAYFQCQKAIARSQLWSVEHLGKKREVPTAGQMTQVFSSLQGREFDGDEYDKNYPEHMKKTIY